MFVLSCRRTQRLPPRLLTAVGSLRMRMDTGVTSTSSSSVMYSRAWGAARRRWGKLQGINNTARRAVPHAAALPLRPQRLWRKGASPHRAP